jgi:hypothetical protein
MRRPLERPFQVTPINGIVQIFRLASDLDSGKQRRQRD